MGGVLHLIAATVIVLGISWCHWLAIPSFFLLGFFWEKTQHRRKFTKVQDTKVLVDGKLSTVFTVRDETFFGWITPHRLWEAAGWGVGGTLAATVLELLSRWEILT
jgi:hypothetical protein